MQSKKIGHWSKSQFSKKKGVYLTSERQKSNRAEMECKRNESVVEGRRKGDNSLERVLAVPRDCCDDRKQSIEGAGVRDAASAPGTAGLRP